MVVSTNTLRLNNDQKEQIMKNKGYLFILLLSSQLMAAEKSIETVEVEGRQINLVGEAISASQGIVGQKEIELRPILRTGEVLELVPGLVVTQHSGTGKANQYFLRGFNLDHGTDFATSVDGMPVNMRTHGHGQGYTDLNFLIPETVAQLAYKKGAYYADVGDFSGAGSAQITTAKSFNKNTTEASLGEDNFSRLLLLNSTPVASGESLFALELNRYDGPWQDIEEDIRKTNVLLKHTVSINEGQLSLALMAYDNRWNSADQIPLRAVEQGIISDLGSLDQTVGGESSRYSVSADWQQGNWQLAAYAIKYQLNLWSNFTYFLDDADNGDQFEQVDDRIIYGGQLSYSSEGKLSNKAMSNHFGGELRIDDIDEVGLYRTRERQRLGTVRSDSVTESSLGVYWENRIEWTDNFRSVLGARYDLFDFDVANNADINFHGVELSENSGNSSDSLVSLKGSLIYNFANGWEAYGSAGQGFHSNDAGAQPFD